VGRTHDYEVLVSWTGDRGAGTTGYRDYGREHEVSAPGVAVVLPGSADPAYRGDAGRWNPEQLLVASLSQCHMLWYLHLCAEAGVVVTGYRDRAVGTLAGAAAGSRFTEAVLHPEVEVTEPGMVRRAEQLHVDAHRACYVAASVAFPVRHLPRVRAVGEQPSGADVIAAGDA